MVVAAALEPVALLATPYLFKSRQSIGGQDGT